MPLSEQALEQLHALPLWPVLPLALGVGIVAWRGWLRPGALRGAPSRKLGFNVADLMIGAGLWLTGMSIGSVAVVSVKDAPLVTYIAATIAAQVLGLGLPALYLGIRASYQPNGLRKIGYVPTYWSRDLLAGVVGAALALMIVPGVILAGTAVGVLFGYKPPEMAHELLVRLHDSRSALGAVLVAVSAIVVAPVLEETIYRGFLQSLLVEAFGEEQRWPAIAFAAAIFMSMHVSGVDWQALPALWVLGAMLGWLYERTGSLLPGVMVHAAFNAFNVGAVLFFFPAPQSPAG